LISLKRTIMATPLYPLARALKRSTRSSGEKLAERRLREFYGAFFEKGDVVFDVGANQGEYSEAFALEGAQVIAIEPNIAYRLRLNALARTHTITPVFVALSDSDGAAKLNVCSTPGYSTLLSPQSEWIEGSPDYVDVEWTDLLEVPLTTMDALADKYGQPVFVKIDVEGFELNVLRGMSFSPRHLSFEFGARRKELGQECLRELASKGYRFRPILGRDFEYATAEWMDHAEAVQWLEAFTTSQAEYGDMFARRGDVG
jgi:FkbM family methyltransferase